MKIKVGNFSSFGWACKELGNALDTISNEARRTASLVAQQYPDDERTLFIVTACPCCEKTGIPGNLEDVILVTPYKGMDHGAQKIISIDIKPPFRHRDGKHEARDEKQFLEHWEKTLRNAIESVCTPTR